MLAGDTNDATAGSSPSNNTYPTRRAHVHVPMAQDTPADHAAVSTGTAIPRSHNNSSSWILKFVVPVVTVALMLFGYYEGILNIIDNECLMTYMYAGYGDIDVPHSPHNARYKLQVYREGNGISPPFTWASGNVPVVFVPGNAGHGNQARSLGAVAAHLTKAGSAPVHMDVFAIHFNEEHGAWRGHMLERQAHYVNTCIQYILAQYAQHDTSGHPPKSVILVGHSMGGIVSRAVLLQEGYAKNSVRTIVTLSTPHLAPPVSVDRSLVALYDDLRRQYDEKEDVLKDVVVVAIHGGDRDVLVHAGLNDIERATNCTSQTLTVSTSSLVDVWIPVDHQCSVWCNQLMTKVVSVLLHIIDPDSKQDTKDVGHRMTLFRHEMALSPARTLNAHVASNPPPPLFQFDGANPVTYEESGLTHQSLTKNERVAFTVKPDRQRYRLDAKHFRHPDIGKGAFILRTDLVPGPDFHILVSDFAATDILDITGVCFPIPNRVPNTRMYMIHIHPKQMTLSDTIWLWFSDDVMKNSADHPVYFAAEFYNPVLTSFDVHTTSLLLGSTHRFTFPASQHRELVTLYFPAVEDHHLVHTLALTPRSSQGAAGSEGHHLGEEDNPVNGAMCTGTRDDHSNPIILQSTPGMREDVWFTRVFDHSGPHFHLKFHQDHGSNTHPDERGLAVHIMVASECGYDVDIGVSIPQSLGNYFRTDTATLIPAAFTVGLLLIARQLFIHAQSAEETVHAVGPLPPLSSPSLLYNRPGSILLLPPLLLFTIVWVTGAPLHRYAVWAAAHAIGYGLLLTLNLLLSFVLSTLATLRLFPGTSPGALSSFLGWKHMSLVVFAAMTAIYLSESIGMTLLLPYVLYTVGNTYARIRSDDNPVVAFYDTQLLHVQQGVVLLAALTILPYFAGLNLFVMNFKQVSSFDTQLPVTSDALLVPVFAAAMYAGVSRLPSREISRYVAWGLIVAALHNTARALDVPCEITMSAAVAWVSILSGTIADNFGLGGGLLGRFGKSHIS